jgi:8-oxo-dGTP pyrophosphatase MutT (NUDIX family)
VSAYQSLRDYAESMKDADSLQLPSTWHLRVANPKKARRAAVLILFGAAGDPAAPGHPAATASELDLLFVERASSLTNHPGQVAFPGGAIDPGDADERAAALREAQEETGLEPAGVEVLGALPEVGLPYSNFLVTPVLGWWALPTPVGVVDLGESAQVFRAPVRDLLNPGNRRTVVVERGGFTSRSPAFVLPEATVWGFTGMLLSSLFDALGWSEPWDDSRIIPPPL